MATAIIDGYEQDYTLINGTTKTYGMATSAINIYTQKYSGFEASQKIQVKWAMKGSSTTLGAAVTLIQEDDKFRAVAKVGGGYVGGVAGATLTEAIIAFAAGLGATLSAPVVIGIGVTAGVVFSTAGSETAGSLYDKIKKWFGIGTGESKTERVNVNENGTTISTTKTLEETLAEFNAIQELQNQNWDIKATIPSVSSPESYAERLAYNNQTQEATLVADETYHEDYLKRLLEAVPKVQQITLNTQTYDVVSEDNKLLIRNAIDDIPKVSFLLSHIDIKGGDILDIGDQGLYTVKGGDTMSQIAEAHGMTTQALLKLNTWLIDEGKVHFDQDINILTCKHFHTTKSLHVRIKIKQKGATHGAQPKVA